MQKQTSIWWNAIRSGLICGAVVLLLSLVGMVVSLDKKYIVSGAFTMGQVLAFAPFFIFGYNTVRRASVKPVFTLLLGPLTGLVGGAVVAAVVALGQVVNLRAMFVNASPALYELLTFKLGLAPGILALLGAAALMGLLAAGIYLLPARLRSAILQAAIWVILLGLLRDLVMTVIKNWGRLFGLLKWMYSDNGLTLSGALFLFLFFGAISFWRYGQKGRPLIVIRNARQKRAASIVTWIGLAIVVLLLPRILGLFFTDILDTVGIYILMGLGLNIVVGFAGLLDLGYVAFYAIGAYTMGVLTSPELNANPLSFWAALPIALLVAVVSGAILGLPVLKMRGDYLAIVTLGFGEIVRLLVLSDWLRPYLGGTQGIQHIAHPTIGLPILKALYSAIPAFLRTMPPPTKPLDLGTQQNLYYVIVIAIAIASFIAWRLKDSRLGRSWMALREDEDVARAMGINHVSVKLLAFASGAFFAGLGGTLFAAKLSSAYPQSFQFLVSINILALLIIGGMGSIPGVIVGGLVLMGLPEVLREFAEYRYLVYGAALVAMMLTKPEGFVPEARRKLELHEEAETPSEQSVPKSAGQQ